MWKVCKDPECVRTNPQSLDNFYKSSWNEDGLNFRCKDCVKRYHKKRRPAMIAAGKRWYAKNGPKIREFHLKHTYGVSSVEYNQMLKNQNGVCAVRGSNNSGKFLHVDHDHVTNMIRGLLCNTCNTGLGAFKDSTSILEKAVKYLKKYSKEA